jgi:hypothetical protein
VVFIDDLDKDQHWRRCASGRGDRRVGVLDSFDNAVGDNAVGYFCAPADSALHTGDHKNEAREALAETCSAGRQFMRGRNLPSKIALRMCPSTAMSRNLMSLISSLNIVPGIGSIVCAAALLVATDAGAETLSMCGQTVPYTVVPPPASVPANMRAFSGLWVGSWASGICNAVIIESIQPDGTVSIFDVWGPDSGKPAGNLRYAGKITGNTLTSAGRVNSIEFTQVSPTQLSATYLTSSVQARATFKRP